MEIWGGLTKYTQEMYSSTNIAEGAAVFKLLSRIWRYKYPILLYVVASAVAQMGPYFFRSLNIQQSVAKASPLLAEVMLANEPSIIAINTLLSISIALFGIPKIKTALSQHLPLNELGLLTFLRMLDVPVEYKLDRFSKKAHEVLSAGDSLNRKVTNPKSIFNEITQPDKQINTIIEAIWYYYKSIDSGNTKIKVVLFFINNGIIDPGEVYYFPRDCAPNTSTDLISDPRTALMRSVRSGKMVVIDSVKNPPKDVIFARAEGDDRDGSLVCAPIKVNRLQQVRMVISLFAEKPKYFTKNDTEIYKFVLEPFQKRLIIEYCLLKIKSAVQDH